MTRGLFLGGGEGVADALLDRIDEIGAREGEMIPAQGAQQYQYEMAARADKVSA